MSLASGLLHVGNTDKLLTRRLHCSVGYIRRGHSLVITSSKSGALVRDYCNILCGSSAMHQQHINVSRWARLYHVNRSSNPALRQRALSAVTSIVISAFVLGSYRELSIAPATRQHLQTTLDIRPNHRNVPGKLPNRNQKVTKQDEQSV